MHHTYIKITSHNTPKKWSPNTTITTTLIAKHNKHNLINCQTFYIHTQKINTLKKNLNYINFYQQPVVNLSTITMRCHHQNASIANMITTTTAPVQVNLNEEQQQASNSSRRDICSESTRINYNKNTIKFIDFVEQCCDNNSSFVADGCSLYSLLIHTTLKMKKSYW